MSLAAQVHAGSERAIENVAVLGRDRRRTRASAGSPGHAAYSRAVRLMKIILPALAAVVVGLVLLWPTLMDSAPDLAFDPSELPLEALQTLTMTGAQYAGVDDRNRPYTVSAERIAEAEPGSGLIRLVAPQADMVVDNRTWISASAAWGDYDQDARSLALDGGVMVFHNQGYHVSAETVTIDLAGGTARSDTRVTGHGPAGEVEAAGFRLDRDGGTLYLKGPARMVIRPDRLPDTGMPR